MAIAGLIFDSYIKFLHAKKFPESAQEDRERLEAQAQSDLLLRGYVPDYQTETFRVEVCFSWHHLIYIMLVQLVIVGKVTIVKLTQVILGRRRLIFAEARPSADGITHRQSKKNLRTIYKYSKH